MVDSYNFTAARSVRHQVITSTNNILGTLWMQHVRCSLAGASDTFIGPVQQRGRAGQPAPGALASPPLVAGQRRPGQEDRTLGCYTCTNAISIAASSSGYIAGQSMWPQHYHCPTILPGQGRGAPDLHSLSQLRAESSTYCRCAYLQPEPVCRGQPSDWVCTCGLMQRLCNPGRLPSCDGRGCVCPGAQGLRWSSRPSRW